jgi:hypothetical protein
MDRLNPQNIGIPGSRHMMKPNCSLAARWDDVSSWHLADHPQRPT